MADLREQDERATGTVDAGAKNPRIAYRVPRNGLARYAALTRSHATIPSLWDQSTDALAASNTDQAEGSSGSVHRAPCDVDLMETRAQIADTIRAHLIDRRLRPRATVPTQARQLAAHIAGHEPDQVPSWAHRFEQWVRVLAVHLQAVQQQHSRRIRGAACPDCGARTVTVTTAGERSVVPTIVIDFHDGYIRAAQCSACGVTLAWRGEQMWQLADRLTEQA